MRSGLASLSRYDTLIRLRCYIADAPKYGTCWLLAGCFSHRKRPLAPSMPPPNANEAMAYKQCLSALLSLSLVLCVPGGVLTPSHVKDLRGLGLMVGLEFEVPQGSGAAAAVTQACLKRGMILLVCSSYESVRFVPPLNVSEAEMEEGLGIFEDAVKEVFG